MDLVREFAASGSDAAFAELVRRHINLVYSVALRRLDNSAEAEEVTQVVFIILARKAGSLRRETILSGWLYRTAQLTSANFRRAAIRREHREQEAFMRFVEDSETDVSWHRLAPLLEDAMLRLRPNERDAVVLRFFENRTVGEVARALGLEQAAAQKRVNRATEKLRKYFLRRGVRVSTSALLASIGTHSVQAAPVELVAKVATTAVLKGAAGSGSMFALMKTTLKVMAWTKTKTAIVAGVGVLLAVGTATVALKEPGTRSDPVRAQVLEIIGMSGDDSYGAAAKIAAIGPRALPTLEQLVRWRKSRWDFFGTAEQEKLRGRATYIVYQLGPAAVRPLTSALCDVVNDPDIARNRTLNDHSLNEYYNTVLPACNALLQYSIADSPHAAAAVSNWLSNPAQTIFIGSGNDAEIFPRLPNVVPLLVPWLRNPYAIAQVTRILGSMGTNAVEAIPALIDASKHGIDTTPPPLKLPGINKGNVTWFTAGMSNEDKARNRGLALTALGQIGVASPEVVVVLQSSLADKNDIVRFTALESLYALHEQPDKPLADLLHSFSPRRSTDFNEIIEWVGSLGDTGHDALPWLDRLTRPGYVDQLPEGLRANLGNDLAVPTETLRASAIVAICEIDPSQIDPGEVNAVELLHQLFYNPDAVKRICSESNSSQVLNILAPLLGSTNTADASLAAYITLGIASENEEALQTLRRCVSEGNPSDRLYAAEWLRERTGDSEILLELTIEGLKSADSGEIAAYQLFRLGSDARPAVPALKAALWNQDAIVRSQAGRALQNIATEELPSIN